MSTIWNPAFATKLLEVPRAWRDVTWPLCRIVLDSGCTVQVFDRAVNVEANAHLGLVAQGTRNVNPVPQRLVLVLSEDCLTNQFRRNKGVDNFHGLQFPVLNWWEFVPRPDSVALSLFHCVLRRAYRNKQCDGWQLVEVLRRMAGT